MSATLNADLFSRYFGAGTPVVEIPGRTFPVEQGTIDIGSLIDNHYFLGMTAMAL